MLREASLSGGQTDRRTREALRTLSSQTAPERLGAGRAGRRRGARRRANRTVCVAAYVQFFSVLIVLVAGALVITIIYRSVLLPSDPPQACPGSGGDASQHRQPSASPPCSSEPPGPHPAPA